MTTMVVPSWCSSWSSSRREAPVARVEVAGGLVGHDQGGPAGQGPGDGGALLLPARQLVGPMPERWASPTRSMADGGQPAAFGHRPPR